MKRWPIMDEIKQQAHQLREKMATAIAEDRLMTALLAAHDLLELTLDHPEAFPHANNVKNELQQALQKIEQQLGMDD